jgi:diguanylate cyclase (GGDEF)-like protein/PAS domain S-box-containing protein
MPLTTHAFSKVIARFKSSLSAQLYGWVACLTLTAWATFYWGHLHSEASGMEQVRLRASTLSLAYAGDLEHTLERTHQALNTAGSLWLKDPSANKEAVRPLLDLLKNYPFRLRFFLPDGKLRSDVGVPTQDALHSYPLDSQWIDPMNTPPGMSIQVIPAQPATLQEELVQIVLPVLEQQQFSGLLVLSVEPAYLTQFSQQIDLTSGTMVAVIGSDGKVLAHSANSPHYLRSPLFTRVAEALQSAASAPMANTLFDDEPEHTFGVYQVPQYSLTVLVGIDTAQQMAPDRQRKHIVLLFAVLFPLLLLGAIRMILQSLERRQALEKTMHKSERLAASVFTHAREGIVITDISGQILDVNTTFTQITGFSRDEVMGRTPQMLESDQQSPEFYTNLLHELALKGHWNGDLWCSRRNGDIFSALVTVSAVPDAINVPQHYVALFTDITEIKDHQRQLAHLAHYDSLSGLPNRVLLADRLRQTMLQCHRRDKFLAVAFLDLDGFKEINDEYGHDVGDTVLISVAKNMKAALRNEDTLARIGGDEFVAVLADLESKVECYCVLDRLLVAAQLPTVIHTKSEITGRELHLYVSTSIGFTFYPQDNVDADQLLRQADQAMYQAKQAGKNRYQLFDVAFDAALKTQTESIERIRQALANEEFVLHFQPKVNMASGQVLGAEALIRWNHPERGLLTPLQFLPIIENHSLSIALGEWVIHTALSQMVQWQTQNLNLCVSVNISAHHLHQDTFSTRLAELLASFPMAKPGDLELEILETSAMEDMSKVTENIHRCHELGVCFALDDFGTGYSSLTYLKRLPAQTLKIDQSFVRDMLEDADDLAIVRSVIGLAQTLRRTVIAEGVETPAHGALLIKLGCPLAQGYGIAKPMPAAEIPVWVAQWQPNFV